MGKILNVMIARGSLLEDNVNSGTRRFRDGNNGGDLHLSEIEDKLNGELIGEVDASVRTIAPWLKTAEDRLLGPTPVNFSVVVKLERMFPGKTCNCHIIAVSICWTLNCQFDSFYSFLSFFGCSSST